jgi:hypothetical protein
MAKRPRRPSIKDFRRVTPALVFLPVMASAAVAKDVTSDEAQKVLTFQLTNLRATTPSCTGMADALCDQVKQRHLEAVKPILAKAGKVTSITLQPPTLDLGPPEFKRYAFDVAFEHDRLIWMLAFDPDGNLSGIRLKPYAAPAAPAEAKKSWLPKT